MSLRPASRGRLRSPKSHRFRPDRRSGGQHPQEPQRKSYDLTVRSTAKNFRLRARCRKIQFIRGRVLQIDLALAGNDATANSRRARVSQSLYDQRQRRRRATTGVIQMVSRVSDRPVIEYLHQPAGSEVFFDDICRHPNEAMVCVGIIVARLEDGCVARQRIDERHQLRGAEEVHGVPWQRRSGRPAFRRRSGCLGSC